MTRSVDLVIASAEPSTQQRRSAGIAPYAPLTRFRVRTYLPGLDPPDGAGCPVSAGLCGDLVSASGEVGRPRPYALRSEILTVGLDAPKIELIKLDVHWLVV